MIAALSNIFTKIASRYLPDAFVFALILTFVVFICGVLVGNSPGQMIDYWGNGMWNLMSFSMQMSLILITGFTLAKTPLISKILHKTASLARGQKSAIFLVTLVSIISCFINWGLGLIVSALFAIEVAKKLKTVNFALILASAYSGFLVWHGGLSGSIPLKLTSPSNNIKEILDIDAVGLNQTIYSSMNLWLLLTTVITLIVINILMHDQEKVVVFNYEDDYEKPNDETNFDNSTIASKIENSFWIFGLIGFMGLSYLIRYFYLGGSFNLNIMIFLFLMLAIMLNGTPKRFLHNFNNSVKDSSGIILQFPFYAGLMGMMSQSGMAKELSEFFVSISSEKTFLLFTYLSAGVVNFFVPSGGGQWAVQGPIILPAAKSLGIDMAKASMAIAWGDAWTNMVQPFWALPLLSIGKVALKDLMGYLVVILVSTGVVSSLVLLFM